MKPKDLDLAPETRPSYSKQFKPWTEHKDKGFQPVPDNCPSCGASAKEDLNYASVALIFMVIGMLTSVVGALWVFARVLSMWVE